MYVPAWINRKSKATWRIPQLPWFIPILILLASIAYICAFKVLDRDFWWHITAGKLMLQSHHLISVEPFSYTRAGLPYLAKYEWLSQVILYIVFALSGIKGIIFFRMGVMAVVLGLLLCLTKKHLWFGVTLAILGATAIRPVLLERPQLFSFMIFAAFIVVTAGVLERGWRKKDIITLLILQVLWVNTHGAASLLAGLFMLVILLERPTDWRKTIGIGAGLGAAMFISPNTYHNLTYLHQLLTDRTIIFINEWRPRPWWIYLRDIGPFWILAAVALLWGKRKNRLGWLAMVLVTGYLSRKAVRHEVFFVMSSLATAYVLLPNSNFYNSIKKWFSNRPALALTTLVVMAALIGLHTRNTYHSFVQRDHLQGFGAFIPAEKAYNFVQQNNLTGHMFNTYGIGGYLIYRGYTQRPVYIDGRNVDYGFVFMSKTYLAGQDPEQWQKLDDQYHFSYALVDYDAARPDGQPPGIPHLNTNPEWALVYVDDWTAVYVRNTPEHADLIKKYKYTIVTPQNLDARFFPKDAKKETLGAELARVVKDSPQGFKGRLSLAQLLTDDKKFDEALQQINNAKAVQPGRAELYETLGTLYGAQQKWALAAEAYYAAIQRAGSAFPDINYDYLSEVFKRGGYPWRATYFHLLAKWQSIGKPKPKAAAMPSVDPSSMPTPDPSLSPAAVLSGLDDDIKKYNEDGIAAAQKGDFKTAEDTFLSALKINPSNPEILNNLGALAQQQGKVTEAIDYYQRALKIDDTYGDAHYNLGTVYYGQHNYTAARTEALAAQKNGKDATALLNALSKVK